MKKYLLGLFAIALAVGFSSFKAKKAFNTPVYYQLSTFAAADVQNVANWSTTAITCQSGSLKACEADVPAEDVDNGAFVSGISIVTSGTSTAKVTDVKLSGTTVNPIITNKN